MFKLNQRIWLSSIIAFLAIVQCPNSRALEFCGNESASNYPAIFSFIYLLRNDPVNFDNLIKDEKYNFGDIAKLNKSFSGIPGIEMGFAFQKDVFLLQGDQPGQFARPAMDMNSEPSMPKPSIFIIHNTPKSNGKTFLIISSVGPTYTKVLSVDGCFDVKLLFYSKRFDIVAYNKVHKRNPFYADGEPMGYPIERVVIGKDGNIELYEFKNSHPYIMRELIGE